MLKSSIKSLYRYFLYMIFAANCIIVSSCSKSSGHSIESKPMSFQIIKTDTILGGPVNAYFTDSQSILVNDAKTNPLINVFNIQTGRNEFQTATIGNGPNELFPPIRTTMVDSTLYILNLADKKVYISNLMDRTLNEVAILSKDVMGIYYISSHQKFIAPVMPVLTDSDEVYPYAYVYDKDFNKVQELESFATLWDKEKNFDRSVLSKFHQIQGIASVDDGGIAILEAHVLRLYHYTKGAYIHKQDILLSPYEYDVYPASKQMMLPHTKLKDGYMKGAKDIVAYGNNILLSVDTDIKGVDSSLQNVELWLMDCDGKHLNTYIPDIPVCSYPLAVSKEGTVLMMTDDENMSLAVTRFPHL